MAIFLLVCNLLSNHMHVCLTCCCLSCSGLRSKDEIVLKRNESLPSVDTWRQVHPYHVGFGLPWWILLEWYFWVVSLTWIVACIHVADCHTNSQLLYAFVDDAWTEITNSFHSLWDWHLPFLLTLELCCVDGIPDLGGLQGEIATDVHTHHGQLADAQAIRQVHKHFLLNVQVVDLTLCLLLWPKVNVMVLHGLAYISCNCLLSKPYCSPLCVVWVKAVILFSIDSTNFLVVASHVFDIFGR